MQYCSMITIEDCFYFGQIAKTHKTDGSLLMAMDCDHPEHYKNQTMFLLSLNDKLTPFFVKELKINGDKAIVLFDSINSLQEAEILVGAEVYLPLKALPVLDESEYYLHELPGLKIIDSVYGEVGQVYQVFEMPQQYVAQVFKGESEILIPLNKVFFEKIDRKSKTLHLNLPDGLLDIYLKPEQSQQDDVSDEGDS